MIAEIGSNYQITLPKEIVSILGLSEGDKLEISEKDGVIYMIPVTVYPKKYVDSIQNEIAQLKKDISDGKQPVFDNIDELTEKLEKD